MKDWISGNTGRNLTQWQKYMFPPSPIEATMFRERCMYVEKPRRLRVAYECLKIPSTKVDESSDRDLTENEVGLTYSLLINSHGIHFSAYHGLMWRQLD